VITFGLNPAAAAVPPAALNPEAAIGCGADFGDVLQQLMGGASGESQAIDLPFDRDDLDANEPDAVDELDELVNAIVVDLAAPPVLRLVTTSAWAVSEAAPAPALAADAVEVPIAGHSVSVPFKTADRSVSGPFTTATAAPVAASDLASNPFDAPESAGMAQAVELPAAGLPAPAIADAAETIETAKAAALAPAPAPAAAARAAIPVPAAAAPTPELPAGPPTPVEVAPTPAAGQRELPATTPASQGVTDKIDATRQPLRMTADLGQRAYAAAASDAPSRDTQQGFGEARRESATGFEPVTAEPSTTPGAPPAQPFHVVADRPAAPVAPSLATPLVVTAAAVDAVVAHELPAQVVQSIRMQTIDGGGEAIVRLRPDYLGELVVAVKVENGAVIAALQSDTPAVRKWVESNEASLRQALAEHGLQLDRLTVSDEAPQTETGDRGQQERDPEEEPQPQSRRQRKPAPDATFEVVV